MNLLTGDVVSEADSRKGDDTEVDGSAVVPVLNYSEYGSWDEHHEHHTQGQDERHIKYFLQAWTVWETVHLQQNIRIIILILILMLLIVNIITVLIMMTMI